MRGIPRKAVELNLPIEGTRLRARDIADDMSKPGAQAFYDSLVHQVSAWGVDFIKADDIVPFPEEITALTNAIERTARRSF